MTDLRRRLARVLWLGGSACAGKTTIARILASDEGIRLYSCDDRFEEHRARSDPALHPGFRRLSARSAEALWEGTLEERVGELDAFYEEEFGMIVEDLLGPSFDGSRVLVEGAGLLPRQVLPLCRSADQAVWLEASAGFRRRHHPRRGPFVGELLKAPGAPGDALERWMERDDRFGAAVAAEAAGLGGTVIPVDGTLEPSRVAATVARFFGLALPS